MMNQWTFIAAVAAFWAAVLVWTTWMSRRQADREAQRRERQQENEHRWQERRDERIREARRSDDQEYLTALRTVIQPRPGVFVADANQIGRVVKAAAERAGRGLGRIATDRDDQETM
ncbi:hypothetical protein [Nakamurella aerolata]|uniref:Uncharacterized protein n=1 Tax=Nakamurella aerolata TaxID=1656892 RepID=A0A849A8P2_9ACTN|nr:hypothetical protein [Nakamurella aerolata]NNG36929.1 hypothetical protein [Nakamurella aerolata]